MFIVRISNSYRLENSIVGQASSSFKLSGLLPVASNRKQTARVKVTGVKTTASILVAENI